MTIDTETTHFAGKTVKSFTINTKESDLKTDVVYRLDQDYEAEESQTELFEHFMTLVEPASVEALVIGEWSEAFDMQPDYVSLLITHHDKFSNLKALFVGDMTYEQCEVSWIQQTNYTPLLEAYPNLQSLKIRGSTELELTAFEHANLETFIIECGGLPAAIIDAIADSTLPKLTHLELWLGDEEYGFDADIENIKNLTCKIDPTRLNYLGLKNSVIQDDIASFVATQAWVAELDTLDLSMGVLKDTGAEALYNSEYVKSVKKLDLHHHFMSGEWQKKLKSLPCDVDVSDTQEADVYDDEVYYFVAVAE